MLKKELIDYNSQSLRVHANLAFPGASPDLIAPNKSVQKDLYPLQLSSILGITF